MNMEKHTNGGCVCGMIRYRFSGEPIFSLNCHCNECQAASGTAHTAVIIVRKHSFELIEGEPTYYARDPENEHCIRRGFCSTCGAPVIMLRPERPKLVYLHAGSLVSPEWYKPSMDIFTAEACSWDAMDPQLDKFSGMPPVPDDLGR